MAINDKLCEVVKIVGNAGPPIEVDAASGLDGKYVNMKGHDNLLAIVALGVTGAAMNLTVEKDADGSGAGTAIVFRYRKEDTAAGDTLDDWAVAATTAGIATSTNDNIFYVIEIDAAELGPDYPYVRVRLSDPAATTYACIIYLLYGGRVQGRTIPTVIV